MYYIKIKEENNQDSRLQFESTAFVEYKKAEKVRQMHRRNSLYRVRMRKKRRVLRGIRQGAKFIVVLIAIVLIFKNQLISLVNSIFEKIVSESSGI